MLGLDSLDLRVLRTLFGKRVGARLACVVVFVALIGFVVEPLQGVKSLLLGETDRRPGPRKDESRSDEDAESPDVRRESQQRSKPEAVTVLHGLLPMGGRADWRGRYVELPRFRLSARAPRSMLQREPYVTIARSEYAEHQGSVEQYVTGRHVYWMQEHGSDLLEGELMLPDVIHALYGGAPHGHYSLRYSIEDHESPRSEINYAYQAQFREQEWRERADGVFESVGDGRSLRMRQPAAKQGYSTIDHDEVFRFGKGLLVEGRFQATQYSEAPVALDVVLIDRDTGDSVSTVFSRNGSSVGVQFKKYVNRVESESEDVLRDFGADTDEDGQISFAIRLQPHSEGTQVQAWVHPAEVRLGERSHISTVVPKTYWGFEPSRIALRIWNGGEIELNELVIAEAQVAH